MNVNQLNERLKETPELLPYVFSHTFLPKERMYLLESIADLPYFWQAKSRWFDKLAEWLLPKPKETDGIDKQLRDIHAFFDFLFIAKQKDKEEELKSALNETFHIRTMVNDVFIRYFKLLNEYEQLCSANETLDKFEAFIFYMKKNVNALQSLAKEILYETTREAFVSFENKLKNKEKEGVIVRETKKLPALSKLKKDGYHALLKELNLYTYEDAMKAVNGFLKKYKLEDLPFSNGLKNRLMLQKGILPHSEDTYTLHIDQLLSESGVFPGYPYFPYTEKTYETFVEALKTDISSYTDSPFRNLVLLLLVHKHAELLEIPFSLSEEETEQFHHIQYTIFSDVCEKMGFLEANRLLQTTDILPLLKETVIVGQESFSVTEFYDVWSTIKHSVRTTMFNNKSIENFSLSFLDKRHSNYGFETSKMQLDYYAVVKAKEPKRYQSLIKQLSSDYSLGEVLCSSYKGQYKNAFFEDVALYQIEHGLLNEKDILLLNGEKFVNYSEYENHFQRMVRGSSEKVQKALLRQIIKLGSKYKEQDFHKWKHMLLSSFLNKKNILLFICTMKPSLFANWMWLEKQDVLNENNVELKAYIEGLDEEETGKMVKAFLN